ncbi:DNA topoisomerase, partial [Mycoplasmopsis bovis]|uniref:DNA topoisomerase n=1 Tax=Mycoplasmopsis bovis TaxID=28903 RepID=UPI003D2C7B0B
KESKKTLPALTPFKQAVLYKRSPFSSSITQASLQRLFEGFGDGGLISYPRTDSTRLSHTFVNATKNYISIKYGDEYVLDSLISLTTRMLVGSISMLFLTDSIY